MIPFRPFHRLAGSPAAIGLEIQDCQSFLPDRVSRIAETVGAAMNPVKPEKVYTSSP